jgi:hypothetical protein
MSLDRKCPVLAVRVLQDVARFWQSLTSLLLDLGNPTIGAGIGVDLSNRSVPRMSVGNFSKK